MTEAPKWVVLAVVLRPQGRKGEVLAELLTDFPERFEGRHVFLAAAGFDGPREKVRTADVTGYWLPVGRNQGRVVLKFEGVDTINDAETLNGLDVLVPFEERAALEDGASYISDLIGCAVLDGGVKIGVIEDVQFAMTSDGSRRLEESAPMLVVRDDAGDEILVPFAKAFVVTVDTVAKRVEMRLPAGLVDVNRS
jgi:16S rRNA processing protein RimM